jgi:hypothetical protein
MTKLNRGLGSVWHVYEKNTGKGIYDIIRVAHSHQSSKELEEWHKEVAAGMDGTPLVKIAQKKCLDDAEKDEDKRKKMLTNGGKSCKMAYLRGYLREVFKEYAKKMGRSSEEKEAKAVPARKRSK